MMGSNRFWVDMPRLADFYMVGKLNLDEMISDHIKLEDINQGVGNLRTSEFARQGVIMETDPPTCPTIP